LQKKDYFQKGRELYSELAGPGSRLHNRNRGIWRDLKINSSNFWTDLNSEGDGAKAGGFPLLNVSYAQPTTDEGRGEKNLEKKGKE